MQEASPETLRWPRRCKARHHDITQAANLCRNLGSGDIVVEDRAPYFPGFEKILNASMGQHIA